MVDSPLDRFVGNPDVGEGLIVEPVLAQQELVDLLQEQTRLGALDDAVVVGRGQGDDLGDAELGQHLRVGRLVLGGVADATDADDGPLALHESRHRLDGADRSRVGEGDVGPGQIVDRDLVVANLVDQRLVGIDELREVELVGLFDDRHHQGPGPVVLLEVDGDTEVHMGVAHQLRLAVVVDLIGVVEAWGGRLDGGDHGVADDMGEADLAAPNTFQVVVEDPAVDLQELGRDLPEAGGRRYLEAGLHVAGDQRGDPSQGDGLGPVIGVGGLLVGTAPAVAGGAARRVAGGG